MSTRFFSARQRKILAWVASGQCNWCGAELPKDFHADHIKPFSKGGPTNTNNGQALCVDCNLKKGDRIC